MPKTLVYVIFFVIFGFIVIRSCNTSSGATYYNDNDTRDVSSLWKETPLKNVVDSLKDVPNFAILLNDMDSKNSNYLHEYKVIVKKPDTVYSFITPWKKVPDLFFDQHMKDMGMEILSKKNGIVQEEVAPPGYTHFVGNPQYGQWERRGNNRFWEFYGQYAFLSTMFNLMAYPIRRDYYDTYYNSYYRTGRRYYGPTSSPVYGTGSYTSSNRGQQTTWASRPSDFKQQVRSRVTRSAQSSRASRRTARSSSRSSSSTSYRSRSGGFGK